MLGKKIKNLRKQKGLTQEEFAEALYVTRQSVSKWELGQAIPDTDKIMDICRFFGITADFLLDEKNADTDKSEIPVANNEKYPKKLFLTINFITALLPLFTAIALFVFMPDKVPVHFSGGDVTRWGSKYEYLILPVIILIVYISLYFLYRYLEKRNIGSVAFQILVVSMITLVLLASLSIVLLSMSYVISVNESGLPKLLPYKIAGVFVGLLYIILGIALFFNKNPNHSFGLRTERTMKSKENWSVSQKVTACCLFFSGTCIVIINSAISSLLINSAITVSLFVLALVLSFAITKLVLDKNEKRVGRQG